MILEGARSAWAQYTVRIANRDDVARSRAFYLNLGITSSQRSRSAVMT